MGVYLEMIPKREREDLRRKCQSKPLAINFDACGSVLLLLDALDEAEHIVLALETTNDNLRTKLDEAERQLSEERKARARDNAAMLKVGPAECG